MGAVALSRRMEELESRLGEDNGGDVTAQDLEKILQEFEAAAAPLRKFVGD
jgi:hypothetical protein